MINTIINRCRQLALYGVVNADVDYAFSDSGSSPTNFQLFSSVFILLLFTTLSYNTRKIMYFE